MKTRLILPGVAAILCAGALSSAQITPQGGIQQSAPRPTTQQPRPTASEERPTTLAGCLYNEGSIPGRTPNAAEKVGVSEDYILADATTREQNRTPDRPIADAGQPGQPPAAPTAGLATGRMYKVTKIGDDQLKPLVGKRVEVTGTIKMDNDRSAGRPASTQNLPNIEGTAIHEVAGASCPASPNR